MLSVLHVYKNYAPTPGGIETHVRQLAIGLTRRGMRSTVLVTAAGRETVEEELEGVRVIRAGRLGEVASTPLSLALVELLRTTPADLLHLHVPYPVGEIGYLLGGRDRPLVVTYHSDVVRQWWAWPAYRPLIQRVLGRAKAIIATSPPYARTSPILRSYSGRCEVIPLAVDPARFRVDGPRVAAIGGRWRSERYPDLILSVGRFRSYKGLLDLIRAARGLPARLLLIGSGPLEPELRRLVDRLGMQDQVVFLGNVDDAELPYYYAACDVFALASSQRSEAFGIVLLEAMAAGRPVVSTELGTGTSWVNQHEVTGLVVRPSDPVALAGAIGALLADPRRASEYGQAGRKRAEAEFGETALLARMETVYRRVVGG